MTSHNQNNTNTNTKKKTNPKPNQTKKPWVLERSLPPAAGRRDMHQTKGTKGPDSRLRQAVPNPVGVSVACAQDLGQAQ